MLPMRFVGTYLVLAFVFAFGFLCAAAFAVGDTARRGVRRSRRTRPVMRLRDKVTGELSPAVSGHCGDRARRRASQSVYF